MNGEPRSGSVGGAPLKLTVERRERICEAIRAGIRPEIAAVYCGIGARTYYRWMQLGRAADADASYVEFAAAVEVALAEWEARDVLLIGEAAKTDWHAAAWRLERRLPAVYGRRERHEHTGGDGGPVQHEIHRLPDPKRALELARLALELEPGPELPDLDGNGQAV